MELEASRIKHESGPSQEQDIISTLPDGVLGHIISLLPLKQAIRLSCLSSRWRNIYTWSHNLNFYYDAFGKPRSEVVAFMEFVDCFITSHTGFIDKFVIKFNQGRLIDRSDSDRIDRWIQHVLSSKVRELYFRISFVATSSFIDVPVPMPIEIFSCKTLEVLTLSGNRILKLPPNYTCCLPNVKSLHLRILGFFDEGSFQRLVSSCSMLEDLVMHNCRLKGQRFNVFNPTLKRFTISYALWLGAIYEFGIDAPNLVYSKCSFHHLQTFQKESNYHAKVGRDMGKHPDYDRSYSTAINLLKVIAHVQSLHLSGVFADVLLQGNGIIPELPKLTYLTLDSFAGWERILPDFHTYFPPLKTLHFKVDLQHSCHTNIITLPSSLWSHLKRLEISSFEDEEDNELQIVDYFLKNAEFLEHFTAHTSTTMTAEKRSQFTEKVFKLPKISENCKILVV